MLQFLLVLILVSLVHADNAPQFIIPLEFPNVSPLPGQNIPQADRVIQPTCDPSYSNAALVLIDMQPYFAKRGVNVDSKENKAKVEKILKAQSDMIHEAKKAGIPIIVIEYDLKMISYKSPEDSATAKVLKDAIGDYPTTKFVTKTSDGEFDTYNLDMDKFTEFSRSKKIGTLIVAGANGGACVRATISGALRHNCNVVAYTKGIADFNYSDFISPYKYNDGMFSSKQAGCSNCSFQQIDDLAQLRYSMKFSGSPTSTQGGSDVSH